MAWYRTGTVSVTNGSASVTGTGTAWIANTAVGQGIILPDGRLYEIAAVTANTSITLAQPYLGSTASGQTYAIVPTRGPELKLAQDIAAMVGSYGAAFEGAGQGKFAAGSTGAPSLRGDADQDTGVNLPGNNILDLITGGVIRGTVSVDGINATNLLRGGSQVYSRNNIVGAVSQVAGVPTGAIIEIGSNANGNYVRLAGGTQIAWREQPLDQSIAANTYAEITWNLPAAFTGNYIVIPNVRSFNDAAGRENAARYLRAAGGFIGLTSAAIGVFNNHTSAVTARVDGLAIGRWF